MKNTASEGYHSRAMRVAPPVWAATVLLLFSLLAIDVRAAELAQPSATTRHNRTALAALARELAQQHHNERYAAVLAGLSWCIRLHDSDTVFGATFSDYITMLDELTLNPSLPRLRRIVRRVIRDEFRRAGPQMASLFSADASGYEDFISLLPAAYRHGVALGPLRRFASRRFANVALPDRMEEFLMAGADRNYDRLTDLIVNAAFVDMAYAAGAERDFVLPPNRLSDMLVECGRIPFVRVFGDEAYQDQNYYATHVVLAINRYGHRRLGSSDLLDAVMSYLVGQFDTLRHRVADLDLLSEYLYCLRISGGYAEPHVLEGEQYIISMQHADGSWGTDDDLSGSPYDRLHPTWTAITLLVQGASAR